MTWFAPTTKLSFGLVILTVSLLLLGDLIGVVPNEDRGLLEGRKKFCESLAIQFSIAVNRGETDLIQATLGTLVAREDDVLSAAIRTASGRVLAESGGHAANWVDIPSNKSTSTHVQVPIFQGKRPWGTVEITFRDLKGTGLLLGISHSLFNLIIFFLVAGFAAYLFFIKRTLRELDPRSVIPERVKSAFNALAEGLVIVDEKQQIILANHSFAEKIEASADSLVGHNLSHLTWMRKNTDREPDSFPWEVTLAENKQCIGVPLRYGSRRKGTHTFTVNTSPIMDGKGSVRGVLATFDDLTDLEKNQSELKQTINQLESSREKLQEKTVELEYLATRDSLTGCLNRRAFFSTCEAIFERARRSNADLACIMADIDHFKSINDRFGHATGDKVIQIVAKELKANARPDDIVGRYGGEEFCIILPDTDVEEAFAVAERFRLMVKKTCEGRFTSSVRITASFGVSVLSGDISNPEELVDRADKALYFSKENGRNRTTCWGDVSDSTDSIECSSEYGKGDKGGARSNDDIQAPSVLNAPVGDIESSAYLRDRIIELEEELAHSRQELVHQLGRDPVTGLPSKLLFNDRVSQALERGRRYNRIAAVVVLEIDLFHRINDALGVVVGDQLLKKAAKRLTEVLRSTDTVTLLGGETAGTSVSRTGFDEFGILLADVKDTDTVTSVVKRIIDCMSESLTIDGNEIFITCNAGISLYPHDGDEAGALLENANAARYRAKQRLGKNNLQYYSADINQESYKQLWLESHLHHALRLKEFSLLYQPQVDLATGRITGMEALLRWESNKLGSVSPQEFIPIAERTGLINEIGEWVIENACRQAKRWHDKGFVDVSVAVNLSVLQFRQKDLSVQILDLIRASGLVPGNLELEITESAVMNQYSDAINIIKELHQAGVRFAVDDFGTGYSSLAYLKHLPVSTLKIDRSFLSDTVPDQQDEIIIRAIIAMGHSMGLKVVAEGVETDKQQEFLQRIKCDEMQGYLVSKPVAEEEAIALLRQYNSVELEEESRSIMA